MEFSGLFCYEHKLPHNQDANRTAQQVAQVPGPCHQSTFYPHKRQITTTNPPPQALTYIFYHTPQLNSVDVFLSIRWMRRKLSEVFNISRAYWALRVLPRDCGKAHRLDVKALAPPTACLPLATGILWHTVPKPSGSSRMVTMTSAAW